MGTFSRELLRCLPLIVWRLRLAIHLLPNVGANGAGLDKRHRHPKRVELIAKGVGDGLEGMLGRAVRGPGRQGPHVPHDGTDVDYAPRAAAQEWEEMLRHLNSTKQVHVEHLPPLAQRRHFDRQVVGDAWGWARKDNDNPSPRCGMQKSNANLYSVRQKAASNKVRTKLFSDSPPSPLPGVGLSKRTGVCVCVRTPYRMQFSGSCVL